MSEWQFCPFCGDDLDTGWECNGCGQDWMEYAFPWQCRSDFRPVSLDKTNFEINTKLRLDLEVEVGRLTAENAELKREPYIQKQQAIHIANLESAAEMLWAVLANVSGGDWEKQTDEWRVAAARWRDEYFKTLEAK